MAETETETETETEIRLDKKLYPTVVDSDFKFLVLPKGQRLVKELPSKMTLESYFLSESNSFPDFYISNKKKKGDDKQRCFVLKRPSKILLLNDNNVIELAKLFSYLSIEGITDRTPKGSIRELLLISGIGEKCSKESVEGGKGKSSHHQESLESEVELSNEDYLLHELMDELPSSDRTLNMYVINLLLFQNIKKVLKKYGCDGYYGKNYKGEIGLCIRPDLVKEV